MIRPIAQARLSVVDQQHMGAPGYEQDGSRPGSPARDDLDSTTHDPVFDEIAALAAQVCDAPIGLVNIVDIDTQNFLGAHGLARITLGRPESFCTHTIAQDGTMIVGDATADSRFRHNPLVAGMPHIRFYAGAPFYSEEGTPVGTVCVLDTKPRDLSPAQRTGLESLAILAGTAFSASGRTGEFPELDAEAAERRYRAVLDTTATGVLILCDSEILFANSATAHMLSAPNAAALIGTNLDERAVETQPLIRPAANERAFWRLRRTDGTEMAAEVLTSPILWAGRRALQVELRDVTAAVLAFGDLADSESRYRQLADNSTDMITLQTETGRYLYVSMGCRALTGFSPDEIAEQGHLELIHPDDLIAFLDSHIQARTARVDRFTLTYRMRHQDGSWVPVESMVQFVRDEAGNVLEFQANTRDITERVLIELNRESADRRFRVAMDNSPIGMGLVSLTGELTEVNRSLCELFDRTNPSLVGTSLDELTHPDDVGRAAAQIARLLAGQNESLELEIRYRRTGGDYVWALRTASVVRTSESAPSYLVVQIQDITPWKTVEETLQRQALSDPLTGLANRLMLTQRLTHALVAAKRRRTTVGLVFIDLDRFKAINDSLGHEAGDSILKQVAERLNRSIREEDTAVRLGGDEFVVLCEDLGGLADLRLVSGRIDAALSEPYRIGDRQVNMTASIGLSVANDDDADSLLRHSDAAMYEAKRRGRGRTQVYDEVSPGKGLDSFTIEEELRLALDLDQLRVFYQPVVNIFDGEVVSFEALVRWQHPTRGLLGPIEFLDIAEDGPLISDIGRWVLRQACRDSALTPKTDIGVNVSARQLGEPGFADLVAETLRESGLAPERLILEITETSILHATPAVLEATAAITATGVRLALDDFGTGHSSLSSLQKLPISFLKIDRSFTSQIGMSPATERLITGILRLAASTGLSVVAEGVEELAQAQFLQEQGCTDAQGYLYGRPAPLSR